MVDNVQQDNGSTSGRHLRILALPISLTRDKVVRQLREVLARNGLEDVNRPISIHVLRNIDGALQVRLDEVSRDVRRGIKEWVHNLGARMKWEAGDYRPPTFRKFVRQREPRGLRVVTWNVNGLLGKRREVVGAISSMRVGIFALQESNLKDHDWPMSVPGFQIFQSNVDPDHGGARGLVLGVATRFQSYLATSTPFWQHVKVLGIHDQTWHVFNVYLPHNRENKKVARRTLKRRVHAVIRDDPNARVMVVGDLNCGPKAAASLFSKAAHMVLTKVKGSEKTFHRRMKWSALDHCLVSQGGLESVGRVNVRRDIDASDHFPLTIKVKAGRIVSSGNAAPRKRVDVDMMWAKKSQLLTDINWRLWEDELIEEGCPGRDDMKEWLDEAASRWETTADNLLVHHKVVTEPKPRKGTPWPTKIKFLVSAKRVAWAEYLAAGAGEKALRYAEYKCARKAAKAELATYNVSEWVNFIQKASDSLIVNNTRQFFKWAQLLTKYKGNRNSNVLRPIRNAAGGLCHSSEAIREVWATHFERLFAGGLHAERDGTYWEASNALPQQEPLAGMDKPLEWLDIQMALQSTRNHKAPGASGLLPEFYKLMLDPVGKDEPPPDRPTSPMQIVFFAIASRMWDSGYIPARWTTDTLVTIGKKGDLTQCDNYRGIALIEIFVKVLTKVATLKLSVALESEGRLAEEQAGFRRQEECLGQVATLLEVVRQRAVKNEGTIVLFIDFKKAYDMVPRQGLLWKLAKAGAHGKVLEFLKGLNVDSRIAIRVGGVLSRVLDVKRGCRQGCAASPICFDVFINDLAIQLREVGVSIPGLAERIASLLFADDLACTLGSVPDLIRACEIITEWSDVNEMAVGILKCGWMVPDCPRLRKQVERASARGQVVIQGQAVPHVDSYEYLGVFLTETAFLPLRGHVVGRLAKFEARWNRLQFFLRSTSIPLRARLRVFQVVCLPVLRWGHELLGPGATHISQLETAYNLALKRIVGSRSKNTIYAMATVRREFKMPSFHEMVARGRLRLVRKIPTLATWVHHLPDMTDFTTGTQSMIKRTKNWLKNFVRTEPDDRDAKEKIAEYFILHEDVTPYISDSLYLYNTAEFADTRLFLQHSSGKAYLARGTLWLARARLSGIWTAYRSAKNGMIDASYLHLCPACRTFIHDAHEEYAELHHILFSCPCYAQHRDILGPLVDLLPVGVGRKNTLILLLGGSVGTTTRPWTAAQWDGREGEVLRYGRRPGYYWVASLLGKCMPAHMGHLWALRIT